MTTSSDATNEHQMRAEFDAAVATAVAAGDPAALLALAQAEAERLNFAGADACCARAEEIDPANWKIPAQRGALAARQGLPREAAAHFQRARAGAPGNISLAQSLCRLMSLFDLPGAVATAEEYLAQPNLALRERALGLELLIQFKEALMRRADGGGKMELGCSYVRDEVERLRDMAAQWLQAEPGSHAAVHLMTRALIGARNPLAAEPYFAALRKAARDEPAAATILDPRFHAALDGVSIETMRGALPEVKIARNGAPAKQLIFCGCDYTYAKRFAAPMLGSFVSHGDSDTLFVLHIFDILPEDVDSYCRRIANLGCGNIMVSTEWTGLRDDRRRWASDAARGYYHAMRFVRFLEVLARNPGVPAWLLDADILFNKPTNILFEFLNGHDLAVALHPGRLDVNNQIAAGLFGCAATERGRAYVRRIAAYLFTCCKEGRLPWGVDQVATYCVYTVMAANGQAPDIHPLTPQIGGGRPNPDAVLWGSKSGPEEPEYATIQAALQRFQLPQP
jgi:hypothetical protein